MLFYILLRLGSISRGLACYSLSCHALAVSAEAWHPILYLRLRLSYHVLAMILSSDSQHRTRTLRLWFKLRLEAKVQLEMCFKLHSLSTSCRARSESITAFRAGHSGRAGAFTTVKYARDCCRDRAWQLSRWVTAFKFPAGRAGKPGRKERELLQRWRRTRLLPRQGLKSLMMRHGLQVPGGPGQAGKPGRLGEEWELQWWIRTRLLPRQGLTTLMPVIMKESLVFKRRPWGAPALEMCKTHDEPEPMSTSGLISVSVTQY